MAKLATAYPFSAIVGQEGLKHALILAAIDPAIGGVLALGDRGTGKTTAVRGLAAVLPEMQAATCAYQCNPDEGDRKCPVCADKQNAGEAIPSKKVTVPVVDLPLGVTEDRVLGALNIERALIDGQKEFEPGLLAAANRGFLYIDEINLLEDHLVDALLDVAASGWNVVEREGISLRHPAQFVLVGSGNPEEGDLRPQLLDRFGLSVEVETPKNIDDRVQVIKRRDSYEAHPQDFNAQWQRETSKLRNRITSAQRALPSIEVSDKMLGLIAEICLTLGTDGLRGELTLIKAARADAAWRKTSAVTERHVQTMAPFALSHRLRRDPLDDARGSARVDRVIKDIVAKRDAA